jgi:2OG-Fe(II) oxygenase superfamily
MPRRSPFNRFAWTVENFTPQALALRQEFAKQFADVFRVHSRRFVWDWWHVEGQYTALRTPAYAYFQGAAYNRFHQQLVQWGRAVLGCHDISPPWLSCYVTGCEQRLHADVPHGPFAFVFSLTDWTNRTFRGGHTMLLREEVLDFAQSFEVKPRVEMNELVHFFEPKFNSLTVFDPAVPHGVARVDGVSDPALGRLVIHGWFVQPRPFVSGPLETAELEAHLDALSTTVLSTIDVPLSGLLSFRLSVTAGGKVASVKVLADTTRVSKIHEPSRTALLERVQHAIKRWKFSKARKSSVVTVPLLFVKE